MPLITPERQLEIAIESLERRRTGDPLPAAVSRLHADGLMDPEIAARLDIGVGKVRGVRRRLRLPSNAVGGQRASG